MNGRLLSLWPLPGGRTAHSRFAIPLEINEPSVCNIKRNSQLADLLPLTSMIIWNEVPIKHWYCFKVVSSTLNNICNTMDNANIFGGIPILLGGDFVQIPPLIHYGNCGTTVFASL